MQYDLIQCLECGCHFVRKTVGHICPKCNGENDDQYRKFITPVKVAYVASFRGSIGGNSTIPHGHVAR